MRKSTIIALAILGVALVMLTILLKAYVQQVEPEITLGQEWTREFTMSLEPNAPRVKVRRVKGEPEGAAVEAGHGDAKPGEAKAPPEQDAKVAVVFGLIVEATPSEETWRADPTGDAFSRRFAAGAFERYGHDRPISWVDVRLSSKGKPKTRAGFRRGEDDRVLVPFALPALAPAPGKPAGG